MYLSLGIVSIRLETIADPNPTVEIVKVYLVPGRALERFGTIWIDEF
jgi:hypothetical protein